MTIEAHDVEAAELRHEQDYVDRAWAARERSRARLGEAAGASAGGKTAVAVGQAARRAAERLGAPDDPVAMGRIDSIDGGTLYIGKHAVTDDDYNLLVIGWQADAATPYFTASVDEPRGLSRKRTFEMQRNVVLGFDDVVFADLAARIDELTQHEAWGVDDAVLRELDATRTGEMRDIVATIHAAQYELVRSPLNQLLVVQGGPGTGKTVVALHRVSWLLYQHRETMAPGDVLVIGPNPTFTRYIRAVLPGLGDTDVAHLDLRSLGPIASSGRTEDDAVARLKGDPRMARLIARAMAQRVRFPEGLDRLDVGIGDSSSVQLDRALVEPELLDRLASASSYTAGRTSMRGWLTAAVGERVRWGTRVLPAAVEAALERVWPSLSAAAFLRDLLSSRERLLAAAGDDFTAGEVQLLVRTASERISEETWSDADVPLLDEANELLSGPPTTYLHVVLDEAQDLSPMQLRSVRRRCRSGSMTVVGDLAQSTGLWARDSWDDVIASLQGDHPATIQQLLLGYRVPQQVFDLAAQLLPHIAPTLDPPSVVRRGPADPDLRRVESDDVAIEAVRAARDHAGRGLFVGIVCPDRHRDEVTAALRRAEISYTDTQDGLLGTSINLVAPAAAKGLEFDAVVVVEPEDVVADGDEGLRLLYVALTRTTRYLTVVHSRRVLPLAEEEPVDDVPAVEHQGALFADLSPQLSLIPEVLPIADTLDAGAPVPLGGPLPARPPLDLPPAPAPPVPVAPAVLAGEAQAEPPAVPSPRYGDEAVAVTLEVPGNDVVLPGLANALVTAVAREVAAQLRAVVHPSSYDDLLDQLRYALHDKEKP